MNYSQTVEAVKGWLNRPEAEPTIPQFISMAEAEMNRRLDCQAMTDVATVSIAGETANLPCDFAGVKSFRLQTSPVQKLEYRRPDAFDDLQSTDVGTPLFYTVIGGKFLFSPTPSATIQARVRYRRKIEALSSASVVNWVSEDHPDLYVYGALKHAALFLGDERGSAWAATFEAALRDANRDAVAHDYGATMQIQPQGVI